MTTELSKINQQQDNEFRAFIRNVQSELGVTQELIADALCVHRTQVHHWTSYEGTQKFPACYLPLLKKHQDEKLDELHFQIIKHLGTGLTVTKESKFLRRKSNGIHSDIADIVKGLGLVMEAVTKHPEKRVAINRYILEIENSVSQMKNEIQEMIRI